MKDQRIEMKIKQKVGMKIEEMNIDVFLNQTSWESTDCLFWLTQVKVLVLKDLKLEDTYQKILLIKLNFDIKRYEEIRKVTTIQGEGYLQDVC